MQIKETIERECCLLDKDFKPYKGDVEDLSWAEKATAMFCIHCGQVYLASKK